MHTKRRCLPPTLATNLCRKDFGVIGRFRGDQDLGDCFLSDNGGLMVDLNSHSLTSIAWAGGAQFKDYLVNILKVRLNVIKLPLIKNKYYNNYRYIIF